MESTEQIFIIMFCKYCGKEIEANSKFCSFCGKQVNGNTILHTLKIPHINKWVMYIYGLWFAVNFALLLIGGAAGYSKTVLFPSAYYEWTDDIRTWEDDPLSNHTHTSYKYWQFDIDFYDITDFLFYAILVPFIIFLLYKIFKSLYQLFTPKRRKEKEQPIVKETNSILNSKSNKTNSSNTILIVYLILCFLIPLIAGAIYHFLYQTA